MNDADRDRIAYVKKHFESGVEGLGIVPVDADLGGELTVSAMRRRRIAPEESGVVTLTLLDVDGVLEWRVGSISAATQARRMARRGERVDGTVVSQVKFLKPLGTSKIVELLQNFDRKMTPRGPDSFYELTKSGDLTAIKNVDTARGVLLLVHGTFSSCEHMIDELKATKEGEKFLKDARQKYDKIVAFEHHTVSRSPFLNAVALDRFFGASKAEIDVVCHSRGGLVVRWWAEGLDNPGRRRRVALVGCPLQGTSLADPTSLRHSVDFLTNVGNVAGKAFGLVPFLNVGAGLMQVLTSVTSFVAKAPIFDAALAMTPGLSAQSRTSNNFERETLDLYPRSKTEYWGVVSDFRPGDVPAWKFWKLFNKERIVNAVGDRFIFEAENDLVVDTSSMSYQLFGAVPNPQAHPRLCYFGPQEQVQHTHYFRQPKTVNFIAKSLKV